MQKWDHGGEKINKMKSRKETVFPEIRRPRSSSSKEPENLAARGVAEAALQA